MRSLSKSIRNVPALAALIAPLAVTAVSGPARAETIEPTTRWHEPYVTLLDVNFVNTGFQARWEYFHCGCGDILVRLEQTAPDGVLTGEMLLIGGRALAARGMVSLSSDLEPMLQAPSVMMQLAFTLLEITMPKGPAWLVERQGLATASRDNDLEIDSTLATGSFAAPWQVTGEAWPSGDGQRRFDLTFEFANPSPEAAGGRTTFTFTGGQDYRRDDFPLAPETPMAGWKLQWISRGETSPAEVEDGLTLQDLRDQAEAEAQAGA
jgi:hypothetical protein